MIFIRLHSCICRSTLVHMARIMKLKKYSSLRKNDLITLVQNHLSSKFIAQSYFAYKNKSKYFVNTTDPITLQDIKPPYFEVELLPGKYSRYNMLSFYSYMIKSGHFKDPYTDLEFSDEQLHIMDTQLTRNGFMKQSLVYMKNNPHKQRFYKRKREREDSLLGIDRQIGSLLSETCDDLIQQSDKSTVHTSCYYTLVHIFFPNFIYLLEQLKSIDIQYSKNCLSDYISWVKNQHTPLEHVIINMLETELSSIIQHT